MCTFLCFYADLWALAWLKYYCKYHKWWADDFQRSYEVGSWAPHSICYSSHTQQEFHQWKWGTVNHKNVLCFVQTLEAKTRQTLTLTYTQKSTRPTVRNFLPYSVQGDSKCKYFPAKLVSRHVWTAYICMWIYCCIHIHTHTIIQTFGVGGMCVSQAAAIEMHGNANGSLIPGIVVLFSMNVCGQQKVPLNAAACV